jgi:hypothetical protein
MSQRVVYTEEKFSIYFLELSTVYFKGVDVTVCNTTCYKNKLHTPSSAENKVGWSYYIIAPFVFMK